MGTGFLMSGGDVAFAIGADALAITAVANTQAVAFGVVAGTVFDVRHGQALAGEAVSVVADGGIGIGDNGPG